LIYIFDGFIFLNKVRIYKSINLMAVLAHQNVYIKMDVSLRYFIDLVILMYRTTKQEMYLTFYLIIYLMYCIFS